MQLSKEKQKRIGATLISRRHLYDNPHKITASDYKMILFTFNTFLMESIISQGLVYKLPFRLGILGALQYKGTGYKPFDYNLYKKTGVKSLMKNLHSEGKIVKLTWITRWPFSNIAPAVREITTFTPSRDVKRRLAHAIFNQNMINKYQYHADAL